MKLAVNANAITFKSEVTLDDFLKCKEYAPEALMLKNKHGKVIAGMDYANIDGNITRRGIVFNDVDAEKHMILTFVEASLATASKEEITAYLKDRYGMVMVYMNTIEAQVAAAMTDVGATLSALDDDISVN